MLLELHDIGQLTKEKSSENGNEEGIVKPPLGSSEWIPDCHEDTTFNKHETIKESLSPTSGSFLQRKEAKTVDNPCNSIKETLLHHILAEVSVLNYNPSSHDDPMHTCNKEVFN